MVTLTVKPRFEVHEIPGSTIRRVCVAKKNDEGKLIGGFDFKDIEEEGPSFMVYFPNGASIHLRNRKELAEAGFDGDPTLVDMETGEHVHEVAPISLKEHSERVTQPERHADPATADVLASLGD